MLRKASLGVTILSIGLLATAPAKADLLYVAGLLTNADMQTGPNTLTPGPASFFTEANVSSPIDFTSIGVTYPGSVSPVAINLPATLNPAGVYQAQSARQNFSSLAQLSAAFPYGTYTFTAINSATGASETASGNFIDELPAAPELTAASYEGLQGMNSQSQYDFQFNAVADTLTDLVITKPGIGIVYSVQLPSNTTDFVLPADVLAADTSYGWELDYYVSTGVGGGPDSPTFGEQFNSITIGTFTTGDASVPAPASFALLGFGLIGALATRMKSRAVRHAHLKAALALAGIAAMAMTQSVEAAPVLDQSNLPVGGQLAANMCGIGQGCFWEEQVTPGVTGTLAGIELYGIGTTTVRVGLGSGFSTGPWIATASGPADGSYIDLSSYDIQVTAGTPFVFDVSGASYYTFGADRPYTGGDTYLEAFPQDPSSDGSALDPGIINIAFQTFVDPAPSDVPAPASMALLTAGLIGISMMQRRRIRASSLA